MQKKYATDYEGIDRRDFLKRFALISAVSLGAATGCSSGSPEGPAYGPAPYTGPEVDNMFYLLPDSSEVLLYDAVAVDTDTQFYIYFSDPMQASSQDAVVLKDFEDQPVPLIFHWDSDVTMLTATPENILHADTEYTLVVTENALTADGTPIQLTGNAQAVFKTTVA